MTYDLFTGNLRLIAEYFQRSETFGGPTRDWLDIYDECSRQVRRSINFLLGGILSQTTDHQQTVAVIGEDLFAIATDQPFRFPSTFTFVLRAFMTLEGAFLHPELHSIGYMLDPKFSFAKVAAPYAQVKKGPFFTS
ncbi:hypothetical protein GW17_00056230 [Ensete ventricosum]|nr:hypothetical protein GW17_00056230 [Ensete ventricosum]